MNIIFAVLAICMITFDNVYGADCRGSGALYRTQRTSTKTNNRFACYWEREQRELQQQQLKAAVRSSARQTSGFDKYWESKQQDAAKSASSRTARKKESPTMTMREWMESQGKWEPQEKKQVVTDDGGAKVKKGKKGRGTILVLGAASSSLDRFADENWEQSKKEKR